jgi:hypothetical protein
MRGDQQIVMAPRIGDQRMLRDVRLAVEHVQTGRAEPAAFQARQQRRFVGDRAARGIEEHRAGLHRREHLGRDETARCV